MLTFLFVLQIFFWLTLALHFVRRNKQARENIIFSSALLLKVLAACAVGWLYLYYYQGGDTIGYYHDAEILSGIFRENVYTYFQAIFGNYEAQDLQYISQSRALFFAKIASVISIFSLQNYWLIAISFSLIHFFASWWFVMQLRATFAISGYVLYPPFLFYPSVVFWSSGLLKESVALALIYILCGIFLQVYQQGFFGKNEIIQFLLSMLCAWLLWMLKYYYAAILLPLLLLLLIIGLLKRYTNVLSNAGRSVLIIVCTLSITFLSIMHLHPNLHPDLFLQAIVRNHELSVAASNEGEYVQYEELEPDLYSFMFYMPKAIFSGLFRPLPGEGNSYLHILAGLENLLLLGLSLAAFFTIILRKKQVDVSIVSIACVLYILTLAGLIAIASPNFGSLVRYKVAYAPFWLFLCLLTLNSSQYFNRNSQSIKKI